MAGIVTVILVMGNIHYNHKHREELAITTSKPLEKPLSWITDIIYEKDWGHHQRGNTRYYISSGLGIWGPRIRVGTRSEYLVLHIMN